MKNEEPKTSYHVKLTSDKNVAQFHKENKYPGTVYVRNLNKIETAVRQNWRMDYHDFTNSTPGLNADTQSYFYCSDQGNSARIKVKINSPWNVQSVEFSGSAKESLEESLNDIGIILKDLSFREGNPF